MCLRVTHFRECLAVMLGGFVLGEVRMVARSSRNLGGLFLHNEVACAVISRAGNMRKL